MDHLNENRNGEKYCNRNHIFQPKALNLKSGNHTHTHNMDSIFLEYDAVSPGNQILFWSNRPSLSGVKMSKKNAHFDPINSKNQYVQEGPISPLWMILQCLKTPGSDYPVTQPPYPKTVTMAIMLAKPSKTVKHIVGTRKWNQNLLTLKLHSLATLNIHDHRIINCYYSPLR